MSKNFKGTLLFDMDGILVDSLTDWLSEYNMMYNDNLKKENIKDWDISLFVKKECGKKIFDILKKPGFYRYPKPMEHSQEVIQRLVDKGFEIVIVSDSPPGDAECDRRLDSTKTSNPADDKRKWLQEYFPMIPKDNVVFTAQKWRVIGDILIDDKPSTFEKFKEENREIILMTYAYNKHLNADKRANNMLEVEQIIYKMFNIS